MGVTRKVSKTGKAGAHPATDTSEAQSGNARQRGLTQRRCGALPCEFEGFLGGRSKGKTENLATQALIISRFQITKKQFFETLIFFCFKMLTNGRDMRGISIL